MIEGGNFNITNTTKPTNQNLVVVFSPAQNTKDYTYVVYKNNNIINTQTINTNQTTNFTLDETGTYQITIKTHDINNKEITVNSGNYIIDKEAPILTIKETNIKIDKDGNLPNNIATASDNYSGNLTNKITNNASTINLNENGKKVITYTVADEAGNTTSKNVNLIVGNGNAYYLYAIQTTIIVFILIIFYLIVKLYKSLKLRERIDSFTIKPLKNDELSIFDRILLWYQTELKKMRKTFEKSTIAAKYSKKLEKYTNISNVHHTGTDIFISKIVLAIILLLLAALVKATTMKLLTPYEALLPLLVGFFLLDIVYFIKYKVYRNKIENDLLSAIIVMNNAFKAGRSITQAIDIVSKEVEGKIGKEFSKMSLELAYGLEIDTVFKRFADRIKIDEVNYLTASLTILTKTGGNIIKVFSSIEKTMFNKKKLRLELKSLTASSRIILYVLFIVPFLFIILVSIISPGYFLPFITTSIGRIILAFMIIYYIIYIIAIRRIMKVVI